MDSWSNGQVDVSVIWLDPIQLLMATPEYEAQWQRQYQSDLQSSEYEAADASRR